MAIFLIRHGETLGNASRTVQLPDNPLSPRGIAQAERLARRLEREGITAILASDFARAAQTAERLARVTGLADPPRPLLQERNFGDIRGTPYAELGFDMFAPDYAPPERRDLGGLPRARGPGLGGRAGERRGRPAGTWPSSPTASSAARSPRAT